MKKIASLAFLATIALGNLSCTDDKTAEADKKEVSTTVDNTTTENSTPDRMTTRTTVEVPAATKTTFETKYPQATDVTWVRYTPQTSVSAEDMDDYAGLDTTDYEVNFDWNGIDYTAWYEPEGSWIKTTYKLVNNANLPASVNDAINTQYPGYSIKEIEIEEEEKGNEYEVFLEKGNELWKVHFDANGKVLKKKNKSGKND
jgi:uncharacterized membrane protein YkoI